MVFEDRLSFGLLQYPVFCLVMRNLFICVALLPYLSVAQSVTRGVQVFPADAFVDAIGVNTHFAFAGRKNKVWEDFEPLAASVHELGIRYVRDNVRLGNKLDRFNRLYTRYGIRTDVVVFQRGIEPDEVVRRSVEWIETFRKTVDPNPAEPEPKGRDGDGCVLSKRTARPCRVGKRRANGNTRWQGDGASRSAARGSLVGRGRDKVVGVGVTL